MYFNVEPYSSVSSTTADVGLFGTDNSGASFYSSSGSSHLNCLPPVGEDGIDWSVCVAGGPYRRPLSEFLAPARGGVPAPPSLLARRQFLLGAFPFLIDSLTGGVIVEWLRVFSFLS